ncbi:MAG: hypothetical protein H6562_07310 [Lewinellaceae bacterium]|nr:hypothetical protein [Lewinella sp.]MCB9278704.1 hypothetical protein [Lewinellaceae bacterium]
MGFLTTLALLITLGVLWLVFTVMKHAAPSEKRMRAELAKMKTDMDAWAGDLVKIDKAELELFSLGQVKKAAKKRFRSAVKGIYTTIFEEPVVAYSFKKFLGKNGLLYARTATHEYGYWIKNNETQVLINGQIVGALRDDGGLYGARTKRLLAKLDKKGAVAFPVTVNQREVASMTKAQPADNKELTARAFQFVKDDLTEEEEVLLLSVVLPEIIQPPVGK